MECTYSSSLQIEGGFGTRAEFAHPHEPWKAGRARACTTPSRGVSSGGSQGEEVAVPVVLVFEGVTQEQYEESVRRLSGGKSRMESPADWPVEGLLAHIAGQVELSRRRRMGIRSCPRELRREADADPSGHRRPGTARDLSRPYVRVGLSRGRRGGQSAAAGRRLPIGASSTPAVAGRSAASASPCRDAPSSRARARSRCARSPYTAPG